jgi:DNA-binding Lrp family transcriptional regulator
MNDQGMYGQAHLFVAAIRILEHSKGRSPSLKEIAETLNLSQEETARISRRLDDAGIIRTAISGTEERFYIKDHLLIENIPREVKAPAMMEEVMRVKAEKEAKLSQIEGMMKKGPAKQDLFLELDKALKDPSAARKKPNPLD